MAQEYEETHGRYALNKFILDSTPDTDYEPSPLHNKLLRLRWADIFTTNWDTLLERACRQVTTKHYSIIRTTTDIAGSSASRIVKLHGTFPSNMPFIFTEEDYRRYPHEFAPFVNFVQQSMMENVFCLIGFSGDDPNFLHWCGWVRDNLGKTAPKIYLVGLHEMAQVKRRELEKRNIIPIDLALIPGISDWPKDKRHYWALEWFLENLEQGERWNRSAWPKSRVEDATKKPAHLRNITPVVEDYPIKEPYCQVNTGPKDQVLEALRQAMPVWEHNRRLYPGWIIAPLGVREQIYHRISGWYWPAVRHLSDLKPWERLFCLREIIWRLEICLVPFDDAIYKHLLQAIDDIDPLKQECKEGGEIVDWERADWRKALAAYTELRIAILRDLREDGKYEEFEEQAKNLENLLEQHDDVRQVLWHHRSLLALEKLDYEAVESILREWDPQHTDHIWALRKAAVLAEINRSQEARRLASDTLVSIRQGMRSDIEDIAMMSREAWCMFFLQNIQDEKSNDRWNELKVHKCNAKEIFDYFKTELRGEPSKPQDVVVKRRFDLGARTASRHYSNDWIHRPAYQFIRLTEVAGIPPRIELPEGGFLDLANYTLERVAYWVKDVDPLRAIRIIIRVCRYDGDEIVETVFRRETMASIEEGKATELADILKAIVEYSSVRVATQTYKGSLWIEKLRATMELLSRFILRIPVNRVEDVLDLAIRLSEHERIRGHLWLVKPLTRLISRAVEAIPPDRWEHIFLRLLQLPTTGYAEFALQELWWLQRDVGDLSKQLKAQRAQNLEEWANTINRLIADASTKDRWRAVWRLKLLYKAEILTEEEAGKFAKALWREDLVDDNGLPVGTDLYPAALLSLPEPEPGLAQQRIRKAYLSAEKATGIPLQDYFCVMRQLLFAGKGVDEFSSDEKLCIKAKILQWAEETEEKKAHVLFDSSSQPEKIQIIAGVADVLPYIDVEESELDKILLRIKLSEDNGYPCFLIYPALILKRNSLSEELIIKFTDALASEEDLCDAAVYGLLAWCRLAENDLIDFPPDDLLSEVGIAIYVRKKNMLWISLGFATWLFKNKTEVAKRLLCDRVTHGLRYLLKETEYGLGQGNLSDPGFDIPLIRKECVRLVLAMKNSEVNNEVIEKWLEVAQNDPLPEVRYLLSSWDLSE